MSNMLRPARAAAMSLLMAGSIAMPVYAAPMAASSSAPAVQTVQTAPKPSLKMQAANFADSTGKNAKKAWKFMNTNRPQSATTLKLRGKAMRAFAPVNRAMGGGLTSVDNKMSRPFLFLMLAFMVVLGLLSMSSATDRTGNYH